VSIDSVTTRLASIQSGITDVNRAFAFDETPNALKDPWLPCFTNYPMASNTLYPENTGNDFITKLRTYSMWLWIVHAQRPIDAARQATMAQGLIGTTESAFYNRPYLEGLRYVRRARLLGDGGVEVSDYAGKSYLTVRFELEVMTMTNVNHQGGD